MADPRAQDRTLDWASDTQREAFLYGPYPNCGSGGFNASKTYAYCLKALYLSDVYPKNRGVIARKVGKELRATTQVTFEKLCPPSAYDRGSWNKQEGLMVMNNGSQILWLHLENDEQIRILRGLEINWFFIDQAEELDEAPFDILMARLGRWDQALVPPEEVRAYEQAQRQPWPWVHPETNRPTPPTYGMLACNPDVEMHWIYRRFHPESSEWQTKWRHRGYRMFEFNSLENKFMTAQNRAELMLKSDEFKRRYVYGLWGNPEGTIHTIPPESIVEFTDPIQASEFLNKLRYTCTLHRTMDHGDSAPTVVLWFAVDRSGNVFCYREYYQPNKLVSYHRQAVSALSVGETYDSQYADPSIFYKTQQKYGGRWCYSDEWATRIYMDPNTAIQWWPGDNDEMGTRNRINEYLQVDPERVHPVTGKKGAPRLFFVKQTPAYPQGCSNAIIETKAQKRTRLGTVDGTTTWSDERDPSVPDHAHDCFSADTLVWTKAEGPMPIADLVGTEGEAWTPRGWQPYTECRQYRDSGPMLRVETESGHVECTPDHLLLTPWGWTPASMLREGIDSVVAHEAFPVNARVLTVREIADAPSYCLSVPEPHAFCVNGGLVVHNCLRYFMASRAPVSATPGRKYPKKSFKAMQAELMKVRRAGL